MSQRTKILTQIVGFRGWKVAEHRWESRDGAAIAPVGGYDVPADARLVLVLERRWAPRCAKCLGIGARCHEKLRARRWADLPASGHPVVLEYAPWRPSCARCGARAVELLAWADPHQRQSRRLQHNLALDAFSMPLSHVSTKWGLSGAPFAEPSSMRSTGGTRPSRRCHSSWPGSTKSGSAGGTSAKRSSSRS
jgi:hypothetical protein